MFSICLYAPLSAYKQLLSWKKTSSSHEQISSPTNSFRIARACFCYICPISLITMWKRRFFFGGGASIYIYICCSLGWSYPFQIPQKESVFLCTVSLHQSLKPGNSMQGNHPEQVLSMTYLKPVFFCVLPLWKSVSLRQLYLQNLQDVWISRASIIVVSSV